MEHEIISNMVIFEFEAERVDQFLLFFFNFTLTISTAYHASFLNYKKRREDYNIEMINFTQLSSNTTTLSSYGIYIS